MRKSFAVRWVRANAEELGVDPDSQPSPWLAAIYSFLCFSVGALIPLISYLFGSDSLWLAMGIGAVALAALGRATAGSVPLALLPHPSPASPAANRGWAPLAEAAFAKAGVSLP